VARCLVLQLMILVLRGGTCACRILRPRWSEPLRPSSRSCYSLLFLSFLHIVADDYAMMPPYAAATGVPGHHQHVHAAAAAAGQRPGQRRGDSLVTPPARGTATPAQRAADPVRTSRPRLAGRATTPRTEAHPAQPTAARPARHRPAMAPGPPRPPPRGAITTPTAGRPRTVRSVRALVLRLARENPSWGIAGCTGNCSPWE